MISTLSVSGNVNNILIKTFLCDTEEDVSSLPHINSKNNCCAAGSTAVCISPTLCVYMLNNNDEWCKI